MMALLIGQSAGDSLNVLNKIAEWATKGKGLELGGKACRTLLAAAPAGGGFGL